MNKRFQIFIWMCLIIPTLILAPIIFIRTRTDGKIIHRTPNIAIQLIDLTTREPIPGAIIAAKWNELDYASLHYTTNDFKVTYLMSNNTGNLIIPPVSSLHLLSDFNNLSMEIYHPYYEFAQLIYFQKNEISIETQNDKKNRIHSRNGQLVIQLLKLDKKYAGVKFIGQKNIPNNNTESIFNKYNDSELWRDINKSNEYFYIFKHDRVHGIKKEFTPDQERSSAFYSSLLEQIYGDAPQKPQWKFQ